MSSTRKKLICLYDGPHITLQRAEYIEDGPYILGIGDRWFVREIPHYGGVEVEEGTFGTLREALDKYDWIVSNHT